VRDADAIIEDKALAWERPSAQERAVGLVMLGTLAAWIMRRRAVRARHHRAAGVTVLFVFDIVGWRDVEGT